MKYTILYSEAWVGLADTANGGDPMSVVFARLEDGNRGWAAGPHGTSSCAVADQLEFVGHLLPSREAALADAESQIAEMAITDDVFHEDDDWDQRTF